MQIHTEQDIFDLSVAIARLPKPQDVYAWQVTYIDGTCTREFDEMRPDGRGWAERKRKQAQTVTLARVDNGAEVQSIDVPANADPVFFRRRTVTVNPNDDSMQHDATSHCIGWKRGDEAQYLFVKDDGSTLLTNNLQAV